MLDIICHMLSKFHKSCWLPCVNTMARKIIKRSIFCHRLQPRVEQQKMADLPRDRISPDDYLGYIKVNRNGWNARVSFTCHVSRAVHLEVVSHLNTLLYQRPYIGKSAVEDLCHATRLTMVANFNGVNWELTKALKGMDHSSIRYWRMEWVVVQPFLWTPSWGN